jgi:hypothetical protein
MATNLLPANVTFNQSNMLAINQSGLTANFATNVNTYTDYLCIYKPN